MFHQNYQRMCVLLNDLRAVINLKVKDGGAGIKSERHKICMMTICMFRICSVSGIGEI